MTADDPICPARSPLGRRCERWNQPAAHLDGHHQAGKYRWPVDADEPEQLALALDAAPAAPALKEAAP